MDNNKATSTENLNRITKEITENYNENELYCISECSMPNRNSIVHVIMGLRQILFPGYFEEEHLTNEAAQTYFVGSKLLSLHDELYAQVRAAFIQYDNATDKCSSEEYSKRAEDVCTAFFNSIGKVQKLLLKDIQAAFDGDPAAKTKKEIIYCYPGLLAIFIYRFAHVLYKMGVPYIPRIMTEYAHGHTGIDINPGADIGEYFFIDHGTGVVVGETTQIGNNVKIYQGVTLGALSTRLGQLLRNKKRHPTIEDNVTIYSNASILGGDTVIGEGSVIGGNSFITKSVPKWTRLTANSTITMEPIRRRPDDVFD